MRLIDASDTAAVDRLVDRGRQNVSAVEPRARQIVRDVQRGGDRALRQWSRRLDGDLGPLVADEREMRAGWDATPADVRRALRLAARHLRRVARAQRPRPFSVTVAPGVRIEQRVEPLGRVGCYVPGGRYPLPSTLLMTAIPARVAGVEDVVAVCPRPAPVVLAAALEAGVSRLYRVGGAQAIAALAYGTASIPRVDKIVGPGNAWVTAAKRLVASDCGIDQDAGPSEIVVWSSQGRPAWIAADLIAQAEHDPDARPILVTTRRRLAEAVVAAIERMAPRTGPARQALRRNGGAVVARSRREARAIVNRIAPEHLVVDRRDDADGCIAGTICVGPWSAQALGDYSSGSNHVLPTGGGARTRGGLSAADFTRVFTVQTVTARGLETIGPAAATLADAEGLTGHAASIRIRTS